MIIPEVYAKAITGNNKPATVPRMRMSLVVHTTWTEKMSLVVHTTWTERRGVHEVIWFIKDRVDGCSEVIWLIKDRVDGCSERRATRGRDKTK